jgi:hypothetical protein
MLTEVRAVDLPARSETRYVRRTPVEFVGKTMVFDIAVRAHRTVAGEPGSFGVTLNVHFLA